MENKNIYYKLTKRDLGKIKKIEEITLTDYEVKNDLISIDNLYTALLDLLCEYNVLNEKYNDLENDLNDNYEKKNIDLYEEYGVNENDYH